MSDESDGWPEDVRASLAGRHLRAHRACEQDGPCVLLEDGEVSVELCAGIGSKAEAAERFTRAAAMLLAVAHELRGGGTVYHTRDRKVVPLHGDRLGNSGPGW